MIIPKNVYYNTSFSGDIYKKDIKKVPMKDALLKMVPQGNEALAKRAENEVPENGKFTPVTVTYKIPDSNNKARIKIEHDEQAPETQRRLSIGVHHENSDRLVSEYLVKGTKKEIIDYLKSPENTKNMVETISNLSQKTDNYYNSL